MGGCLPAPASWASPWVLSSASPATPATVEVRTATTPALQVSSERGRRAAPGDSPAGSQHCPAGPRCPRVRTRGKMCSLKILTTCINFSVAKGVHHFTSQILELLPLDASHPHAPPRPAKRVRAKFSGEARVVHGVRTGVWPALADRAGVPQVAAGRGGPATLPGHGLPRRVPARPLPRQHSYQTRRRLAPCRP